MSRFRRAAWAGSRNWESLLFGSLDPGNFITVAKPPVSQWVMGLSGQLFGFGSASMLAPQALMAVATVALLYGMVTRVTGARGAGLLAGGVSQHYTAQHMNGLAVYDLTTAPH